MSRDLLTYLNNVLDIESVKNSLHASGAIHAARKELIRQAKLIADLREENEKLKDEIHQLRRYSASSVVPWNRSRTGT